MELATTGIIAIALGVAVLFLGKNLRLFAAAAGFFIGISVVSSLFTGTLLLGLILGLVLAVVFVILLSIGKGFVQLIARIIGAVAGAAIALWLMRSLGLDQGLINWVVAIVGAVIGFGLMARFFDLGIVILTSLLGASLIVSGVQSFILLGAGISTLATLALAVVGFIVQRRR